MREQKEHFRITRTCINCGRKEYIDVSKKEAAFELVNIDEVFGKKCIQCGSGSFGTALPRPNLDFDLLKEWAINPELQLMPQDEDLLIAEGQYLDIVLQTLDTVNMSVGKQSVLIEALCVIVYDNTVGVNEKGDKELKARTIQELNRRIHLVKETEHDMRPYIKQVVFPQLDFG